MLPGWRPKILFTMLVKTMVKDVSEFVRPELTPNVTGHKPAAGTSRNWSGLAGARHARSFSGKGH